MFTQTVYESRIQRARRKTYGRLFFIAGLCLTTLATFVLVFTLIQVFVNGALISDVAAGSVFSWLSWTALPLVAVVCSIVAWYLRHSHARLLVICSVALLLADGASFLVNHYRQKVSSTPASASASSATSVITPI